MTCRPPNLSEKLASALLIIADLPGELLKPAFRRYCTEHKMTFVGLLSRTPTP